MEDQQKNNAQFLDVTYSDDNTVVTFHGPSEHGGIMTRVVMFDDENRPATMTRDTKGVLMELDAYNNCVFEKRVSITFRAEEPYFIPLPKPRPQS